MSDKIIEIAGRKIGKGQPAYIIAEMSANHNQSYDDAVQIIKAAKDSGADAVKIQTYTCDTMTINCNSDSFMIKGDSPWAGRNFYELYQEAYTPWEWQPKLKKVADEIGITLFSTPFDETAVDFLEEMNVPCYKIASFELIDIPLLEKVASTGKPVIMSTGMGTLSEIEEAVKTLRNCGVKDILLLKCTSSYPAPPEEANLATIIHMSEMFDLPVGLSDHTLGIAVPVAAVVMGAVAIEKHFTLSRKKEGPDSFFSIEPAEMKELVNSVRVAERSIGKVCYEPTAKEMDSRKFRRSLFAVKDIIMGERLTKENIRSIRPADGLPPKYLKHILGKHASTNIAFGSPLSWDLIE